MRRALVAAGVVLLVLAVFVPPSAGGDRPFSTSKLFVKIGPAPEEKESGGGSGNTGAGGRFSKEQIERFRCSSSGDPAATVDISCNTTRYNQHWNPDNELAVAVDPEDPQHLLAGSNDYFYRFNNSTGARQAIVLTGFFTSFDGGQTWIDGQIPVRSGNGAGDPAPAFQARDDVALMAQLENTAGHGGPVVAQGDVAVSRSLDGGRNWSEPVTVFKGTGAGIGPANNAIFWDKEYIAVDNNESSPSYGRIVVTATRFVNGRQGSYAESAIFLSYSDDGGATWSRPQEISGSHPNCTFQTTGSGTECDEDQFSYPEFGPDGSLLVHFHNYQHEAAWEVPEDFDAQIMVVKAPPGAGAPSFGAPVQVVDIEDGLSDMPWSVIGRQTIWGHQIRWTAAGTISVDPTDPNDVAIIYADRGTPNPNATPGCADSAPGDPPNYDPCNAGPSSNTNVYLARSTDGGQTWSGRIPLDTGPTQQWFPWIDHLPDGRYAAAWDEDLEASSPAGAGQQPANDEFVHVLQVEGRGKQQLAPTTGDIPSENPDISLTHWSGQYVTEDLWPDVCGPEGYSDPPVANAEGKDCNQFHGDYTGLATGSDFSVNVVWTGLNREETSTQRDPYTGGLHNGFVQDAMFARRSGL
ncbi:MAG: sialidase family protein [Actinomycetota bacterium]